MQPAVMTGPGRGPGLQNYHPGGEEVLSGREGEPAGEVHQDRRDVGRRKKGKKPMNYLARVHSLITNCPGITRKYLFFISVNVQ